MNFNFELILFYAVVISGVLALFDILFLAPSRRKRDARHMKANAEKSKPPLLFDYARDFFPVLLIVFLLRSFLYEPFRIPSTSLEPTLLVGDFILVNKFDYGIRLPVIHKKIIENQSPKRGDILVLRWPPNPSMNFIKRVIGLPGDHISYIDKELYVNNVKIPQEYLEDELYRDENGGQTTVHKKQEDLLGVKHLIYVDGGRLNIDHKDIVVPEHMYFVMGDNRDYSADSRYWGFVPDDHIVGKAIMVWLSWDGYEKTMRWNRIGKLINQS